MPASGLQVILRLPGEEEEADGGEGGQQDAQQQQQQNGGGDVEMADGEAAGPEGGEGGYEARDINAALRDVFGSDDDDI